MIDRWKGKGEVINVLPCIDLLNHVALNFKGAMWLLENCTGVNPSKSALHLHTKCQVRHLKMRHLAGSKPAMAS